MKTITLTTKNKLLVFTPLRFAICIPLSLFVVFIGVFSQRIIYFYFGYGNTFIYNGHLAVHFVDVGYGDCNIIQLPDGKLCIIDGGSDYYLQRIDRYIKERIRPKRRRIDYVINTHPDKDHTDGLKYICKEYNVGVFIDYTNFAEYSLIIEKDYRIKTSVYKEYIEGQPLPSDTNALSPIITLEYTSQVFVFTGDAPIATERKFIVTESAQEIFGGGRADRITTYLKVGHHGSATSTSADFLDFIKPSMAIVSVGTLYNLPNKNVMSRIQERQIETHLTRDEGNIVIQCNDDKVEKFFAYDNPPNLTGIWVTVFAAIITLCFINLKKTQDIVYKKC